MKKNRSHFSQIYFVIFPSIFLLFNSCTKDASTAVTQSSYSITFQLSHSFGSAPFQYAPQKYITAANDTVQFAQLEYYFTNIKLTKTDGSVYFPGTYYLVSLDNPASQTITINNIPAGSYNKISFYVGVDSAHNHSGTQTGALDPAYSMFWTWNVGFIFYRINGNFNSANTTFGFDLGGDANLMMYDLPAYFQFEKNLTVNLNMDVKQLFQNPNIYDLKVDSKDIHNTTDASIPKLVQNAKNMFSITSIQ